MIKMEHITKSFKNNVVLNDVTLNFEKGKIYGLIGRNASGKSVLFKMICGFLEPDSGIVEVDGVDIYKEGCFPRNISALIEKTRFMEDLTGFENLVLLSKIKNKINKNEIKKILDKVLISEDDQKKVVKNYSVGTKQKLGIAQVLMEDDDILIFDEPFNGLDDNSVNNIRKIILDEKKKGKLIIIASHIKEDINLLCDVVYRIDNGKVKKYEE